MIANRPSIYIYVNQPDGDLLRQVTSGIEEEGVFFEVITRDDRMTDRLAFDAATDSMLGAGVGIFKNRVALQLRGVPYGKNVESYENPTAKESRNLGANSARAIKKQAFK